MLTLIYILKVNWYEIFVADHITIISMNFSKDRLYYNWDTAIFVNSDLNLHFQGQMICFFVACHNAVIVVEIW